MIDRAAREAAIKVARMHWNAERKELREIETGYPMPAWSRARAWQKRPYLLAAQHGKHPDDS